MFLDLNVLQSFAFGSALQVMKVAQQVNGPWDMDPSCINLIEIDVYAVWIRRHMARDKMLFISFVSMKQSVSVIDIIITRIIVTHHIHFMSVFGCQRTCTSSTSPSHSNLSSISRCGCGSGNSSGGSGHLLFIASIDRLVRWGSIATRCGRNAPADQ